MAQAVALGGDRGGEPGRASADDDEVVGLTSPLILTGRTRPWRVPAGQRSLTPMHDDDSLRSSLTRRRFLQLSATGTRPLSTVAAAAPSVAQDAGARPVITSGVQAGDVEARSRGGVVPRRPAGAAWADPLRLRPDALAGARERAVRADVGAEADFTARLRSDGPSAGPAHRLRGALRGPWPASSANRCAARSGRRRGRRGGRRRRSVSSGAATSLGQGWGIDDARGGMRIVRDDARRRARLVHPLRRRDLRRQPARGGGARSTTAPRGATWSTTGASEGRRDARRVPRQLSLQPSRRARPRASTPRCRWSCSGTTTRC